MEKQRKRIRIFDIKHYREMPFEKRVPITDHRVEIRPRKDFFMRRGLIRVDPALTKEDWFWECLLSFAVVCRSQIKIDYKHLNGKAHYEMEILSRWLPIVGEKEKTPVYVIEITNIEKQEKPEVDPELMDHLEKGAKIGKSVESEQFEFPKPNEGEEVTKG